ncbi:CRISPR-associated Csd1 family protein [Gloeomargarita lithophora Alchichica-D10]|uniref:CRISPR-associated Csd1 family protein n=1 Tax=Gloeomargarita lithophora Alchichica-D10 TaxID=1188229 RepID=A0A1J0ACN6_9CYAN|nr:type I-C CRISPR-associated protein Cas8c/Csd1 [Gloeomargarita lithophora]APB33681.1 CRISPR-associated Csd1 family protein [Gloeomargarita lithophora Alchichica-D10]
MLRELYQLSQQGSMALPTVGYGFVVASLQIDIPLLIAQPLTDTDAKGKEKLGRKLLLPDVIRTVNDKALPVADTGSYVLGLGKKGLIRQSLYRQLLEECYESTGDEVVKSVLESINHLDPEKIRKDCAPWFDLNPNKPDEDPLEKARIIFFYKGQIITDRPSVKDFWAKKFSDKSSDAEAGISESGDKGICSVTGKYTSLVKDKMPVMIKGVPATQGKGAALQSFNFNSSKSRKWESTDHAPISFDVAVRSHQMLNRFLSDDKHSYKQGDCVFVYWGDYDTGLNPVLWDDPEVLWEDPSAEVANMIFVSAEYPQGFNTDACKAEKFYLAILTGCEGRIAISRWDESTPQKIAQNVTNFIHVQRQIAKAKPIWQLAGSCFRDPSKDHIAPVVRALIGNALWGDPIPQSVVQQAMERIHLDMFSDKKDQKKYHGRSIARFQVLALYLGETMADKRHLKIAQHLGAIAYLMHRAEMEARELDDDGKTGVAGSLKALANTPKQVFGRLYQNAILYHLPTNTTDSKRRGRLNRTKYLLTKEFSHLEEIDISPETDLPNTFSIDETAWFYMGWGLREATFWQKENEAEENTTDTIITQQEQNQ